jgi:hypothetical protein
MARCRMTTATVANGRARYAISLNDANAAPAATSPVARHQPMRRSARQAAAATPSTKAADSRYSPPKSTAGLAEPAATSPAPVANGTVAANVDGARSNSGPRVTTLSASSTAATVSTTAAANETSRNGIVIGTPARSPSVYASRSSDFSSIRPSGRKFPSVRYPPIERSVCGTMRNG